MTPRNPLLLLYRHLQPSIPHPLPTQAHTPVSKVALGQQLTGDPLRALLRHLLSEGEQTKNLLREVEFKCGRQESMPENVMIWRFGVINEYRVREKGSTLARSLNYSNSRCSSTSDPNVQGPTALLQVTKPSDVIRNLAGLQLNSSYSLFFIFPSTAFGGSEGRTREST